MSKNTTIPTRSTKLNEVKNVKTQKVLDMEGIDKLFVNVTKEISKEVISSTVRKAVRSSELQRKYPPVPDHIRTLSEPTKATYIELYNKHRKILRPQTVGKVKEKIAEYLKYVFYYIEAEVQSRSLILNASMSPTCFHRTKILYFVCSHRISKFNGLQLSLSE